MQNRSHRDVVLSTDHTGGTGTRYVRSVCTRALHEHERVHVRCGTHMMRPIMFMSACGMWHVRMRRACILCVSLSAEPKVEAHSACHTAFRVPDGLKLLAYRPTRKGGMRSQRLAKRVRLTRLSCAAEGRCRWQRRAS